MKTLNKLRNLLHWQPQPKPHVDLNHEIYGLLKPFRLPGILVVLTMMFGSIGYMIIDDFSLMDAIYQTGITFTTVGFGEIAPISYQGQIFTVTLIIIGFLIFTISIGIVAEVLKRGEILNLIKERNMLYKIARLKNHFVLCYHNEFTAQVAKQLRQSHVPFVVVDPSVDLEEIAKKNDYPYYVNENPHTNKALLKSFLSSAKGLISLSDNIADNIATIASARLYETEIGKDIPFQIISKANNAQDEDKILKLGADKAVIPTKLMAQRVSSIAVRPDMVNLIERFMYSQDSALDMEEVFIPKRSWLVLRKLKESRFRNITNVSVVGIRRKDGVFISMPKGDELVTSECKLLLIGKAEGIALTKKLIHKTDKPKELSYV